MKKEISGGASETTNNQMELTAVIEALKALKEPCEVEVFTDSAYVCNALKLDGTVVATGSSMFGACNVNDWADIIAISAGKDFSVGVKADGTIVSAGGMSIGGQNDFSGWEDVIAVSTNTSHTVGLRNDGVVMATGSSMSGQCNVFSWKLFDDLGEI